MTNHYEDAREAWDAKVRADEKPKRKNHKLEAAYGTEPLKAQAMWISDLQLQNAELKKQIKQLEMAKAFQLAAVFHELNRLRNEKTLDNSIGFTYYT
jgi:hypothetical protein